MKVGIRALKPDILQLESTRKKPNVTVLSLTANFGKKYRLRPRGGAGREGRGMGGFYV